MKIHVLGKSGMLGNYVMSYLSKHYECIGYNRGNFDCSLDSYDLHNLDCKEGDIVINCIGVIKPRMSEVGEENAIFVNGILPRLLSKHCSSRGARLYHVTTDCVFSGSKGTPYCENDYHDALDLYGRTKSMGEPEDCCVIRTSIIGEEANTKRSFIEWAKSEKRNTVFGYSNHYWNGVTCLELSKVLKKFIEENIYWKGARHVFTDVAYSKLDMVNMISEIWDLELNVSAKAAMPDCNRMLSSIYTDRYVFQNLREQLLELRDFDLLRG